MGKLLSTPEGFRYHKPKRWNAKQLPRGKSNNGYIDDSGNEWIKGQNHHFKSEIDPSTGQPYAYEWDVQLKNGSYYNVHPKEGPL